YRSCAFLIQRSKQKPGETPIFDMLLSFAASSEDPVSGGRHKVLGSKSLMVPPQTSTIASHLPKAVGAAYSIGLTNRLGKALRPEASAAGKDEFLSEKALGDRCMPDDSVIVCNFGDASANHSTAQGAINAACWTSYQNSPMPIVFICEDNGIGISVRTPQGWIAASFSHRPGLEYFYCDGLDLLDTYRTTVAAVNYARKHRKPVFLHCRMVRLTGHAGSDAEIGYRTLAEIEAIEAQDPLLHTARTLVEYDICTPRQIHDRYAEMEAQVDRVAEQAILRPKLKNATEVMRSIVPADRNRSRAEEFRSPMPLAPEDLRARLFAREKTQIEKPQHMARLINLALMDIMLQYPQSVVFGEDVGRKGGVYGVTPGLQQKFGPSRVIDTLLDEQTILGLAIGLAHNGFIPIPEIQFLAYVHNAEDQIRGEAATLPFFSNGQYTNPMVVRIPGLAYQKGFGGHFHNDNSFNVFRDIPGLILACPSNGRDAVQMLRRCVALAYEERRVVIFLEPIALYATRDLHQVGDSLWAADYEAPLPAEKTAKETAWGEPGVSGEGEDLCILSYGNGYYLSRKAAKILEQEQGIGVRVVDLRWLVPLNEQRILEEVRQCRHTLIVDECRRSGSVSEALMTLLVEAGVSTPFARLTAEDSFIPLAAASNLVLPDVDGIIGAAADLLAIKPGKIDAASAKKKT
ncbi:MAG: thiamine pyrophosphate-dependent enzyme, partial [Gammaproteobacteria bacterium]|nr:thiamine pyrophosphate-dependent enzyme [Gammaproteobacteria bacterium]